MPETRPPATPEPGAAADDPAEPALASETLPDERDASVRRVASGPLEPRYGMPPTEIGLIRSLRASCPQVVLLSTTPLLTSQYCRCPGVGW